MSAKDKEDLANLHIDKDIFYDSSEMRFYYSFEEKIASSSVIKIALESEFLANGPKVFELSSIVCESLEKIELTLKCEDYQQPFPIICIDFPSDYATNRFVYSDADKSKKHYPRYAMVKYENKNKMLWIYVYMNSGDSITRTFDLYRDPDKTFECKMKDIKTIQISAMELEQTEEEVILVDNICRIAFNTALLSVNYGCSEKLDEFKLKMLQKIKTCPKKFIEKNKKEIKFRPAFYQLDQKITFFKKEGNSQSCDTQSSSRKHWHWRKGHWRNQPYGPNNTLVKRIVIPPVLINAQDFDGRNFKTVYEAS